MTILRLLTYTATPEEARAIAAGLLEARLVACANIGSVFESHYVWRGAREVSDETQLWLKTRVDLREAVMAEVARLHPYEVPLIAADEVMVNAAYRDWVIAQTS
ncbi:divalent-cation tolerance protein CutA [Thioclava sp. A2]|uniref:divalent-cation tolerance protein CutA n=1 Tax=Thioclava sp. FCG-A2 TaxID=3080562 RepID=UPI002952B7DD|nr:divalent-cation tolerance protein CutA [Thioclava sp. A2]MDV7271465.1 divalent-cation tolerance protein CutA [Thioclava sp. A2]